MSARSGSRAGLIEVEMSRYRDDRAALEANIERLESELEEAVQRRAELDGEDPLRPSTEIEETAGARATIGVPKSLSLHAELQGGVSEQGLDGIAAMLRSRLNLPLTVLSGGIRSPDGRFELRSIEGRTEMRLDWAFGRDERRHQVSVALSTLAAAVGSGLLLHQAVGLSTAASLSSLLWIVPVVGVVLSPLLGPPHARRALHEQELIRDAFRAAVALAEQDQLPKRSRIAEHFAEDEEEDLATSDAGDFEGDAGGTDSEDDAAEAEDEEAEASA